MRQRRALLVFLVALKRYSERMSHKRLCPSRGLARLPHAPDEPAIEVEFGIIDGHGPHSRRPRRSAKGTRATFAPTDKEIALSNAAKMQVYPQSAGLGSSWSPTKRRLTSSSCGNARRARINGGAQRSKWCASSLFARCTCCAPPQLEGQGVILITLIISIKFWTNFGETNPITRASARRKLTTDGCSTAGCAALTLKLHEMRGASDLGSGGTSSCASDTGGKAVAGRTVSPSYYAAIQWSDGGGSRCSLSLQRSSGCSSRRSSCCWYWRSWARRGLETVGGERFAQSGSQRSSSSSPSR